MTVMAYPPSTAHAAPQIFGLVASARPIPLTCAAGVCTAELTIVCLQKHRPAPFPGVAYEPSKKTRITLAVAGPDGVPRTVDITPKASFKALRGISSVAISIPETTVRKIGSGDATVSVAAMASIIPISRPGDKNPQGALEIENYTGALRSLAEHVIDADDTNITVVRYLNQVINRLPDDIADDRAKFRSAWREVVDDESRRRSPEAYRRSSQVAAQCRGEMKIGMLTSMKSCIISRHDALASETTKKVWNALKPNS